MPFVDRHSLNLIFSRNKSSKLTVKRIISKDLKILNLKSEAPSIQKFLNNALYFDIKDLENSNNIFKVYSKKLYEKKYKEALRFARGGHYI